MPSGHYSQGEYSFLFLDKYVGVIFLRDARLICSCCSPWQATLLLYLMLYPEERRGAVCPGTLELEREMGTCPCATSELMATGAVLWVCVSVVPVWEPRAGVIVMNSPLRV